MPIGSQNQWAEFFKTASFELEANSFIPILWFMLFKSEHLHWAKYIDDLDIDDELNQNTFLDYQEDFADSSYAYLVIDQTQALSNLEQCRLLFINTFTNENLIHFEHFKTLIQNHFPDYILLRTSGLPLDLNDDSFLVQPLQQIETSLHDHDLVQQHEFIEAQKTELARFDDHPYFFYGVNNALKISKKSDDIEQSVTELDHLDKSQTSHPTTAPSGFTIWICTAIVVVITLAVYFTSHSILYSAVVFFISAFVLGFISSKIGK